MEKKTENKKHGFSDVTGLLHRSGFGFRLKGRRAIAAAAPPPPPAAAAVSQSVSQSVLAQPEGKRQARQAGKR